MIKKYIAVLVLFLVCAGAYAQNESYGIWTNAVAEYGKKKWDFAAELEFRNRGLYDTLYRTSFQPEFAYAIIKPLEIGFSYTIMSFYDAKYDDNQVRHRVTPFIQGKLKAGRFGFSLREKYEVTYKDESDRVKESGKIDTYKMNPEKAWRNKLKVNYDIPGIKLEPFVSAETFYQLNNPDGNRLEKIRYILGLEYKINKHHSVDISGILNHTVDKDEPGKEYIIGIGYKFDI